VADLEFAAERPDLEVVAQLAGILRHGHAQRGVPQSWLMLNNEQLGYPA
jgi:hypothetical protein